MAAQLPFLEDKIPSSPTKVAIIGTQMRFCPFFFHAQAFSTSPSSIFIALTESKEDETLSDPIEEGN